MRVTCPSVSPLRADLSGLKDPRGAGAEVLCATGMSVLRPLDKQPGLNTATILLVGTEDALLQQLADSMLKEDCASELKVHLARSLPLPSNVNRPRIDLIMFVVNLHSKYSLRNVEESLRHVDATFFLGKVGFLATGAGRESQCSVHRSTVVRLARTYRSPLLFCDPEALPGRNFQFCSTHKETHSRSQGIDPVPVFPSAADRVRGCYLSTKMGQALRLPPAESGERDRGPRVPRQKDLPRPGSLAVG
ncbi:centromere protein M isoform X2 [Neovison vison]|uniref:centromere protein M isoform X2 n=1 Tax=Neovison vison TaxID=452646 RepID=UPI001CEFEFE3|nr:centromere protein M isoform X2 [Neogale vison]